jgi:toxin-antitoxin system PIN domain toxin
VRHEVPDVNVLLYAFRPETAHGPAALAWLRDHLSDPTGYAMSGPTLAAFVRIAMRSNALLPAASVVDVIAFARAVVDPRRGTVLQPGGAHLELFYGLVERTGWTGKSVADAAHAALAIEHRVVWTTFDSDFARVPGLTWRHLPEGQLRTNPT